MIRKLIFVIGMLLVATPALAQNIQCANRPAGDDSNACANTRFVHDAISGLPISIPQFANTVYAGPTSGSPATPSFRALTDADLPGGVNGTGAVVLTTSPTLVTPILGNATATSIASQFLSASTSVVTPTIAGGVAANSSVLIESTAGSGTSDHIAFATGSQVIRGRIGSDGSMLWTPGTASIPTAAFGGTPTGVAAWAVVDSDSAPLTGTERYTSFFQNTSAGTGDGTVPGTTYTIGASAIKANWTATTVPGQTTAVTAIARGGDNNVIDSGDVTAYLGNAAVSFSNNYVAQFEATSNYLPGGSTADPAVLSTRVQLGPIRATGLGDFRNQVSFGVAATADNGTNGTAFFANNRGSNPAFGTAGKWSAFLGYDYDDGVHSTYRAFTVGQSGDLTLAGPGTFGTNQKTIRVGVSVPNNLEITNAASSVLIFSMSDTGLITGGSGAFTANGASGTPTLTNLLPSGGHTTIQEWFTIKDSSGNTRFIPAY